MPAPGLRVLQPADSPSPSRQAAQGRPGSAYPDWYWRSLSYFSAYRLIVACVMLATVAMFGDTMAFGAHDLRLFVYVSLAYVLFSALCFVPVRKRRPRFHWQLSLQVGQRERRRRR